MGVEAGDLGCPAVQYTSACGGGGEIYFFREVLLGIWGFFLLDRAEAFTPCPGRLQRKRLSLTASPASGRGEEWALEFFLGKLPKKLQRGAKTPTPLQYQNDAKSGQLRTELVTQGQTWSFPVKAGHFRPKENGAGPFAVPRRSFDALWPDQTMRLSLLPQ